MLGATETFFVVIIIAFNIILVFTFFNMASRLKQIRDATDALLKLELAKDTSKKDAKCACGKEYSVSILKKGVFKCKECGKEIKL